MPLLEFSIYESIVLAKPLFLTVDKEGNARIIDDIHYVKQLQKGEMASHIIIDFNKVIDANIPQLYTKPNFSNTPGLTQAETEVLNAVRQKGFQSIKITKKNGEIDMIEGIERVNSERRVIDLLREGKYQNIEVKQEKGKGGSISRTMKKKIKK